MATRPSTRGSARSSARGGKAEESKESLSSAPVDRKAKLQLDYAASSDDALTLRSAILALQTQIQQEEAQLTHFSHLKAQALQVYEGEKERRRSLKLELKDRLSDKSELQDSQRYELLVYKEKMKGLMGDHTEELNGVAVTQKEAELQSDLSHRTIESALMEDHRGLLYHSQQVDTQIHHLVHRLKLQHEEATMHMREHYERRSNHLRLHYQKQLKNQRELMEEHKKKSTSTLGAEEEQRDHSPTELSEEDHRRHEEILHRHHPRQPGTHQKPQGRGRGYEEEGGLVHSGDEADSKGEREAGGAASGE